MGCDIRGHLASMSPGPGRRDSRRIDESPALPGARSGGPLNSTHEPPPDAVEPTFHTGPHGQCSWLPTSATDLPQAIDQLTKFDDIWMVGTECLPGVNQQPGQDPVGTVQVA